jgi:dihydroxyacid dehydratase/phosphogluconate dehydratase
MDDPDLLVTKDSVLVLQHGGPVGGPGFPEWGMMGIPKKLLQVWAPGSKLSDNLSKSGATCTQIYAL